MPKLYPLPGRWRDAVFAGIAVLVVVADQLSKWWITAHLAIGESLVDYGFFRIVRGQNTGAAFGIFEGHSLIFTIVDFVGIAALLALVLGFSRRWPFLDKMWVRAGIGLILGGTIGNLIDRLRFGKVTDFLDFKLWPAFNVADACITVGAVILFFCIIFLYKSSGTRS
jgi:signal peptidase II